MEVTEANLSDLAAQAKRHLVAVVWPGAGAQPQTNCSWRVLKDCGAEGNYAYWNQWGGGKPDRLAPEPKALWAEDEGSAVGLFLGPVGLRREDLHGEGCAEATHFVRAFTVGASSPDQECSAEYWRPLAGCRSPRWAQLVALSAKTPEASTSSMDLMEVTVGEYAKCVEQGKCKVPGIQPEGVRESGRLCNYGVKGRDKHPVNCLSWTEAKTFCRFAGKRLPTSAEWSEAAQSTPSSVFLWGSHWPPPHGSGNFADERAQDRFPYWVTLEGYADGFAGTAPVGISKNDRSSTGVLDLSGNVREWVSDGEGEYRWVRGASFGEADPEALKIKRKTAYRRDVKSAHIGFRCIKKVKPSPDGKPQ